MYERYYLRVYFESSKCYEGYFKSINHVAKFVSGFDLDHCDFLCRDTIYSKDVDVAEMLEVWNL